MPDEARELYIADLILRYIHQQTGHGGRNHMLPKFPVPALPQVVELRSDNGVNLVGAEHELNRAVEGWTQINSTFKMESNGLSIPPSGSHDGLWERLIRSVQNV